MTNSRASQDVGRRPGAARQVAGAIVIMAGAVPIALLIAADYGRPPKLYAVLAAIGATALLAWAVDGRRYLGAGAASLAVGLGIGIAAETDIPRYQNALVFGFLGVALLLVSVVNPRAVRGAAGLLLFTGGSAALAVSQERLSFPEAWIYAALMVAWGAVVLATLGRGKRAVQAQPLTAAQAEPVAARRPRQRV